MRILDPGHKFGLRHISGNGETILQFHKDGAIHDCETIEGPSCQEAIRAIISRTEELDKELPWSGNADIIQHLRSALAGFEARALLRAVEKGEIPIEQLPLNKKGHLQIGGVDFYLVPSSLSFPPEERIGWPTNILKTVWIIQSAIRKSEQYYAEASNGPRKERTAYWAPHLQDKNIMLYRTPEEANLAIKNDNYISDVVGGAIATAYNVFMKNGKRVTSKPC